MTRLLCILVIILTASCARTVYVPTETERTALRTDTLRITALRCDSVYIRDSVYFATDSLTSTVIQVKERIRYRYVCATDTVYKAVTDTVHSTCTVTNTVQVSKPLHWWQSALMWTGLLSLITLIAYIIKLRHKQ